MFSENELVLLVITGIWLTPNWGLFWGQVDPAVLIIIVISYSATMVTSICWNDSCNVLASISDHKLSIWYHPAVAYIDQDLVNKTVITREQG